ncbi:Hemolysin III-like protein [Corynebacterium pseudotuberculosis]|nr:Hemolysin III-like protein [Corynebacterium pseudotuberculosis]
MKKAVVVDRGQRPQTRGWFHAVASLFALVSGAILATFAWLMLAWWQALGVTIYVLGTIALFGVSASYHLGRWRSINTVNRWRRADHATIAVFIAATYTPLCLVALPPSTAAWVLIVAWTGAVLGVVLALVWVDHPRWLAVSVYLVLGWLVIPVIPNLWANAGPAIVWLLAAGGVVYSPGRRCLCTALAGSQCTVSTAITNIFIQPLSWLLLRTMWLSGCW